MKIFKYYGMVVVFFLFGLLGELQAKYETVSFPSGSETISAKLALPPEKTSYPAIIVIHEWWGLTPWVEQKGEFLVNEGYAVLAVDLYRGRVTTDRDEAHELSRGLPEDRALRDLGAAFDYLQKLPALKDQKIGVVGWCMGGGYAIKFATVRPDLDACALFYGSLPTDEEALKKINCPVIGFFGTEDRGIPIEAVKQFEATMKKLEKNVSIRLYEKAGHAFMNQDRPSYNKEASVDSWKRCLTFFSNHLKAESKPSK
jgi:carboxymethylenebutenolidase